MSDAHTSDFRGTDWFMECLSGKTGTKQSIAWQQEYVSETQWFVEYKVTNAAKFVKIPSAKKDGRHERFFFG